MPQDEGSPSYQVVSANNARANPLLIPSSILIGSTIIGLFLMVGLSHGGGVSSGSGSTAAAAQEVNIKDVKTTNDPYIGNANAPVVMAFWSDYQCPYCKAFEVGGVPQINNTIPPAMPSIITQYVDTGRLKIVFKDFPFLGNDSITGAEYARAIWDLYPQQFYNWRVAMFKAQDGENQGFGKAASIDSLIKQQFPQLDDAKIKAQIVAKKKSYDDAMQADRTEGEAFGIQGTPGFIVGTKLIGGDATLSDFSAVIDPLLK